MINSKIVIYFIYIIFLLILPAFIFADQIDENLIKARLLSGKYLETVSAYPSNSKIDQAINIYNSVLSDSTATKLQKAEAKKEIAMCYQYKKEYDNEIKVLNEFMDDNDITIEDMEFALYQRGYVEYLKNDYQSAILTYTKLKNNFAYSGKNSKVPYGVYMWGLCLDALGDMAGAKAKYQEVIKEYDKHEAKTAAQWQIQ